MSTATYPEKFAAAVRDILPDGFTVRADASLATARFDNGAALLGWTPSGDRRKSPTRADAEAWVEGAKARLIRDMYHYTEKAKAEGAALLDALNGAEVHA